MRIPLYLAAALFILPAASAAWTSFHGDNTNSGYVDDPDFEVFKDQWWVTKLAAPEETDPATFMPGQIEASPVIKDGKVIVVDADGIVRALSFESGAELWRHEMGGKVSATPVVEGSFVFVVTEAGILKKLNLQDGEPPENGKESVNVGATLASPAVYLQNIYIGNEAGQMRRYDTETLNEDWTFTVTEVNDVATHGPSGVTGCSEPHDGGAIRGAPAVFQGNVIFGSLNDRVYAIDANGRPDGTTFVKWTHQTGDRVFASPTVDVDEEYVVFVSTDAMVYAFDTNPGTEGENDCYGTHNLPRWTYEVDEFASTSLRSSPATDGQNVYFGASDHKIYALGLTTGDLEWTRTTGDVVTSSPAVSNGIVVAGSDDDKVYWLDADDGSVIKTRQLADSVKASPAIESGRVVVASFDGSVYMFGPELPTRPDLVPVSISGAADRISVTVENQGDRAAGASVLRLEVDGVEAAILDVPELDVGNSTTVTHTMELAPGSHPVKATVNFENTVTEDAANNVLEQTVTVADPNAPTPSAGGTGGDGGDDNGVPGPGLALLLVAIGAAFVAARRR